ncbi:hypothetical protein Lal_00031602 [Lupinus albus]|uniref:Putative HSP20-like chaperone n=1 Tax=Lupinus albus TaxID=3870 RepID=A0A6A5P358_LUPAL|nr:putative HSP20-like chaperone [Lupinus albus]KAF1891793.1 hypothetical protein Lal_00031602 [Lupinus albus]
MAMKQKLPTFITQQPSMYENVLPKSEMKETEEAYLLHIQLPGFTKERIRITFVGSSRMLRVAGERPIVGANRWNHLDQTYPIPHNCEVDKLHANFEHGILTVTMPKKLVSQVTPKAQVKTTQQNVPNPSNKPLAKESIPQKSTKSSVEESDGDRKSTSILSTVKDLKEQKGAHKDTPIAQGPNEISQKLEDNERLRAMIPSEPLFREPRPQNILQETVQKAKLTAATPKQQTDRSEKGQKEIEAQPTLSMDSRKHTDEKFQEEIRQKTILATVKKQLSEKEEITKKEVKEEYWMPYKSRNLEKDMNHMEIFKGKEIRTRKYSPKSSAPKASEKDTIGKGIREVVSYASNVVTRIGEGKLNDEEKPLVANIGAAILVIVALGAYVSYKFVSSDRT